VGHRGYDITLFLFPADDKRISSLAGLAGVKIRVAPVVRVQLPKKKVTRLGWRPALALAVEAVPAAPQWHPLLQQRV